MNPAVAQLILGILEFGFEAWRQNDNRDAAWTPTAEDWDSLKAKANKTLEEYEAEAFAKLGKPYVPPPN